MSRMCGRVFLAALLLLLLGTAAPVSAQGGVTVYFTPSGTRYISAGLQVKVTFCSDVGVNPWGVQITLNSADVTSQFTNQGASSFCTGLEYVGTIQLSAGDNTLWAYATDYWSMSGSGETYYTLETDDEGGTGTATTVTIAYANRHRDVSRCVADCFAATAAYATPTYTSLDVARGLTLVYRSDRARPIGMVAFDAQDATPSAVQSYALLLKRPDNSLVTFVGGQQELFFTPRSSGPTRLAAQFDTSGGVPTGATKYTAVIRTRYNNGWPMIETTVNARVMIVNGGGSPYGAGWDIAQLQRAHVQGDGVLVASGDGSMSWFFGVGDCTGTCQFLSPPGDFSTLTREADGTYTRRYPDGTRYFFNSSGYSTSVQDRFGYGPSFSADARLYSVTDPAGYSISLSYENGNLASITTPAVGGGATRTSWFDVVSGDLISARHPDSLSSVAATYSGHQLTQLIDRRGGQWNYTYASGGGLDTVRAPTITASGQSLRPTTIQSAPSGEVLRAIVSGYGTSGSPVSATLDLRARVTNPRNYTTYFTINRWDAPTRVDDALGRSATNEYATSSGQLVRSVAPSGHDLRFGWDGPRLVVDSNATTGEVVRAAYETTYSQPTHVWGNTVEQWFYYNGSNVLQTSRAGSSSAPATSYSFDARGRVTSVSDPDGHATTYHYSGSGLQNTDSVVAPGQRTTRFGYDVYGRTVATTRRAGGSIIDSVYYDALGRTTATVVDAGYSGLRTTFEYDSLGLWRVTDARSLQWVYVHNALGWVEQETPPGSSTALRTFYNANGGVDSTINRRDGVVRFTYDSLDRVRARTADGATTTYSYGPTDNYTAVANGESVDTVYLGAAGRPSSVKTWRGSSWYALAPTFNTDGQRTQLAATSNMWSGSRTSSMTYTALKQPNVFTTFAGATTLGYDNDGMPTSISYPNGLTKSQPVTSIHGPVAGEYSVSALNTAFGLRFEADSLGRFFRFWKAASTDSVRGYWYNQDGSLMGQSVYGPYAPCGTWSEDFGYSCYSGPSIVGWTYSYNWDATGNPVSASDSVIPGTNRLLEHAGFTMEYDADGNVTRKYGNNSDQTFTWNTLGQLTRVQGNNYDVQFGYDGLGRRVRKTVGGTTTAYLHDGDDLLMELDGSGNLNAEYAYWPGTDQPHALDRGGTTYYYITDPRAGSVRGVVRASDNAIVGQYSYDPFGQLEAGAVENVTNSIRYAAREYDAETGLYYNRARYYDPAIERFTSEDPIGIEGGINLYQYAGNNPIGNRDPSGKDYYVTECTWVGFDLCIERLVSSPEVIGYPLKDGFGGAVGDANWASLSEVWGSNASTMHSQRTLDPHSYVAIVRMSCDQLSWSGPPASRAAGVFNITLHQGWGISLFGVLALREYSGTAKYWSILGLAQNTGVIGSFPVRGVVDCGLGLGTVVGNHPEGSVYRSPFPRLW